MFVRFFGRSTCVTIRLVSVRSGLSTHAFANVGWDRLRRVAQLIAVDQSELSVAEQAVGFIRHRACDLEKAKLGHVKNVGLLLAIIGTAIPRPRSISRIHTLFFTTFFTTHFTPFFTLYREKKREKRREIGRESRRVLPFDPPDLPFGESRLPLRISTADVA